MLSFSLLCFYFSPPLILSLSLSIYFSPRLFLWHDLHVFVKITIVWMLSRLEQFIFSTQIWFGEYIKSLLVFISNLNLFCIKSTPFFICHSLFLYVALFFYMSLSFSICLSLFLYVALFFLYVALFLYVSFSF